MSGGGLFVKRGGELTELIEQSYDAEAELQQLLAQHPELLAGGDIDPDDPRRFVPELAKQMGDSPAMTPWAYAHVIRELEGKPIVSAEKQVQRARGKLAGPVGTSRPRRRMMRGAGLDAPGSTPSGY